MQLVRVVLLPLLALWFSAAAAAENITLKIEHVR